MGYGFARNTGCALAMLGPGLWSVDARLFGWKRVEASPRKTSSQLLKDSFIDHQISCLAEAISFPVRVCDLSRSGAVCKWNSLDNSLIRKRHRFPFVWQPIGISKGTFCGRGRYLADIKPAGGYGECTCTTSSTEYSW